MIQKLVIESDNKESLTTALYLYLCNYMSRRPTAYSDYGRQNNIPARLSFYSYRPDEAKVNIKDIWIPKDNKDAAQFLTSFINEWLLTMKDNYGPEPDCDGHNTRGWRLEASEDSAYISLEVTPCWISYHK